MIKVEIKPVYSTSCSSLAQTSNIVPAPDFLEKTVKLFGITVLRKVVKPIRESGSGFTTITI